MLHVLSLLLSTISAPSLVRPEFVSLSLTCLPTRFSVPLNLKIMGDDGMIGSRVPNYTDGGDDTSTAPFSCHQCRKSKLKCDRTRPCCSRCLKQSYECVYSSSRQPYRSRNRGQAKELEAKLGMLQSAWVQWVWLVERAVTKSST